MTPAIAASPFSIAPRIQAIAEKAVAHRFQVATHAIGDGANHTVLEAYAAALKGTNDRRFCIEHAQVIAPGDFAAFAKYSILASMQPTHATRVICLGPPIAWVRNA